MAKKKIEEDTKMEETVLENQEVAVEEQQEDVVVEEETLDETAASETLKPGGASKMEMMKVVMGEMSKMEKSDLVSFFDKVQSQFGPNKDWGVGDNSAKNASSIDAKGAAGPKTADPMPKISVKEDIEEMFSGEDLSEEFKERVTTIFEAAIAAKMSVEVARIEEDFNSKLEEEVTNLEEELVSKIDSYMEYVAEEWMTENEVAIESTLRNEIMEEFIDSLKETFEKHYISMPEEKVDVVESLTAKIQELEETLDKAITENVELKSSALESEMEKVFESLSSDLALTQVEKFKALAEGIEFDGDLETYQKKLSIVKENYFAKAEKAPSQTVVTEEFDSEETTEPVYVDPRVRNYVQAISRTVKR